MSYEESKEILRLEMLNKSFLLACKFGKIEEVRNILEGKDELNWSTGLEIACENGYKDILLLMLEKGVEGLNKALCKSCKGGHMELCLLIIEQLKKRNIPVNWIEAFNHACYGGHMDIILNLECKEPDWEMALRYACVRGHLQVVNFILSTSEKFNEACKRNVFMRLLDIDNVFSSYIVYACQGGNLDIVKKLVKEGAKDFNNGLLMACRYGHAQVAKFLIDSGADMFNEGLIRGCENGHGDICKLMIQHGAYRCYCKKPLNEH